MAKRKNPFTPSPSPKRRMFSRAASSAKIPFRSASAAALRRMSALRMARTAAGAIGRGAAKLNPYLAGAMTAVDAGTFLYDRFKKAPAKKRYRGSASNAKYVGRFPAGKKKVSMADQYINKGIVVKQEHGGIATSVRQVVYVAHSTMPVRKVADAMIRALVKKLFWIGGHSIKNDNELILNGAYYPGVIKIQHKEKDGDVVSTVDFAVPVTATLGSIASNIYTWMSGLPISQNQFQLLNMRFYIQYGTTTDALDLRSEIDLISTKVKLYSRSILKIQNRTINTPESKQEDDVDNVPLEGRMFEFKSNGTLYRDFNAPPTAERAMITTSTFDGCLQNPLPSENGTSFYSELPERSQFVGCYASAKSVLDPGQIKDSKMVDEQTWGFQKLFHTIFAYGSSNIGGTNQFWIGRTRIFGFEKKINAVAMTSENQFNLAFEHQMEIGADIIAKKIQQTAPVIFANTYAS